jgi:hypothetical protein
MAGDPLLAEKPGHDFMGVLAGLPSQDLDLGGRGGIVATMSGEEIAGKGSGIAKLTGGVAIINVGGATETEVKERKDLVDDAFHTTKAAVEEGVVPGGGVALIRALPALDRVKAVSEDEKYGVNIVRFHKWTGHNGWDGVMRADDPMEFDEKRTRLFDNIHAEFKKRGIYVGWSTIFTIKADDTLAKYIPNFPEIKAGISKRGAGMFSDSLYPLQTVATDIQDYFIALTVKWLNRKNTVTGRSTTAPTYGMIIRHPAIQHVSTTASRTIAPAARPSTKQNRP